MSVPLSWIIGRPELGLELVVGDGRATTIAWAHPIELVDPGPYLSGDELVMTTGLRLPRTRAEQHAYVDRLVTAGAAALGFGVGVRFADVPVGLVERCGEHGLPLVRIPLPTPFIAVSRAVAQRLADDRQASLQSVIAFQDALTRATLRSGLLGLVPMLANHLDGPVAVLDEAGAVLATAQVEPDLLAEIPGHVARIRAALRSKGPTTAAVAGGLELHALAGRVTRRGWLVARAPAIGDPLARVALNHAVTLATLQLDRTREVEEAHLWLGELALSLVLEAAPAPADVVRRLRHFGFDPGDDVVLLVATDPSGTVGRGDTGERVGVVVHDQLATLGLHHLVSRSDRDLRVLVAAAQAELAVDRLKAVVRAEGLVGTTIGVSGVVRPEMAAAAVLPAQRAAAAAHRDRKKVAWFERLTLESVLGDDVVRDRVRALSESTLAPLLSDPAADRLVETLEVFLHHNGAWEPASRALGVHRHTLRNRIARVEQLLGMTLDVGDNRVVLTLALATRQAP
jgi:purine catabolism regulator